MTRPIISVFHHKFGCSVAIVHNENPAEYWARVDGYEGGDGEQWLESFDLPPMFEAAPELLEALTGLCSLMEKTEMWDEMAARAKGGPDEVNRVADKVLRAVNKAKRKVE